MSGHLKYDVATGHLLYGDDGHLVWKCYFEAEAGLIAPPAQLDADATFVVRTYLGEADLNAGAATLDADATFTVRTYAATAELIAPNAELAATGDHDHPSYDATAVLTAGAATLESAASHVAFQDCLIDGVTDASTMTQGMRALAWTAPHTGYFFYIDGDLRFVYRKTTDYGQNWTAPVPLHIAGNSNSWDIWFDRWTPGDTGNVIHLWYGHVGDDKVYYRALDTSTDTLGTERTVYTGATFNINQRCFVSGAKMRGGNLLCCFGQASAQLGTYRSTDNGATWTARTNLVETFTDVAQVFPGNETDDNDAWILYHDASANELTQKIHDDSADTNGESLVICNVQQFNFLNRWCFTGTIRHSDGHLIVGAIEFDASSDFRVFDIQTAITEKTALSTNNLNILYPSIYVDDADRIYLTYIGKRDGSESLSLGARVYYSRSDDGGTTWSSDEIVSADIRGWRFTWCAPNGPNFSVAWSGGVFSTDVYINCQTPVLTHAGTAALTAPAATLTATGVRGLTYTATAALTARAARLVAIGQTTEEEIRTGTAELEAGAATLTASGQHDTRSYSATSVLTAAPAELHGFATFDEAGATTAVLVAKGAFLVAHATHTEDTYSATSALTAGAATLDADASFVPDGTNAAAVLIAKGATLTASATHTEKTYTATAVLTAGEATLSASAQFSLEDESTGTATLRAGAATLSASGTHTEKTYTATATLTARRATLSASASHEPDTYTGTASLTAGAASLSGSAQFTESAEFDCNNCQTGTTPSSVIVRICAPANGSCSDCAELEGDYVLEQDQNEPYCTYFHSSSSPCGTLNIQLTFTETSIIGGITVNGISPTAIGVAATAPYDCEAQRTLTVTPNPFGECVFSGSTVILNPTGCQHCTSGTTPDSLTLTLSGAPTNNGCEDCNLVGNSWTMTRDCSNPCSYSYFGSTACGDISVTATISNTGIAGTVTLDNTIHVQFSVSLTAPFDCSTTRTVSVIGSSGPTCDFSHITSGTIDG